MFSNMISLNCALEKKNEEFNALENDDYFFIII